MITRSQIKARRPAVERKTAWALLIFSWLSSVSAFADGWNGLYQGLVQQRWEWLFAVSALGCAFQAGLTWGQWAYWDSHRIAWPLRLIDALMTVSGNLAIAAAWFWPIFAPLRFWALGPVELFLGTLFLFGVFVAWWPEQKLVQRDTPAAQVRQEAKQHGSHQRASVPAHAGSGGTGDRQRDRQGHRLPDQRPVPESYVEQTHDAA